VVCCCWPRGNDRRRVSVDVFAAHVNSVPASIYRDWGTHYKYNPVKKGCTYHPLRITGCIVTETLLFLALRPNSGHALLIHEVSRSHKTTHHIRVDVFARAISPSQISLPDNTQHSTQTSMLPAGFEPTHLSGEQSQGERPLGPAAKTHNQRTSPPTKNVSDLCKQGTPLKSSLEHWLACLRYYLNFLGPAPKKYRNIISRRTSRARPLISKSLRTTHACIRRCSILFYTGSFVK